MPIGCEYGNEDSKRGGAPPPSQRSIGASNLFGSQNLELKNDRRSFR